jgi:hypothetical protein
MSSFYGANPGPNQSLITANFNASNISEHGPRPDYKELKKKHISIHSEDRNMERFPNSNQFSIELPADITNITEATISTWSFPSNYSTFSLLNDNVHLTFTIPVPHNPSAQPDSLQARIYEALSAKSSSDNPQYAIQIDSGFYAPEIMCVELTNRFNSAVTNYIVDYFNSQGWNDSIEEFANTDGYTEFIIVYHEVSQNIWFGNQSSGFVITNEPQTQTQVNDPNISCLRRNTLPDFSNRGLPPFLGLPPHNVESQTYEKPTNDILLLRLLPRFYYGDVFPDDNGYWLRPNTTTYPDSTAHWLAAPFKINLMGPSDLYLEISDLNHIDETSPFNSDEFTRTTNQTNSRVNASFAKLPIPSTPISQWFDKHIPFKKTFVPPLPRLRRLNISIRYHNGQLVNFGLFNYTFVLEFTMLEPHIVQPYTIVNSLQNQGI